ncbi:MAG: hypothetical protein COV99_08490 [Bacteroidetes bacterium CG12_big_fil_rev_8_21_14_0_65_60_17]|nr:MAG: hypothetical protein COV99_08490 [Bacteroidetes bacterium CG12_big_fil_rev_8_21_14_0_65_60_17]
MRYLLGILLFGVAVSACDSSSSEDRDVRGFWDVENPDVRGHLEITDETFSLVIVPPQPDLDCIIVASSDILTIGDDTVHYYSFDGDTLVLELGPSGEVVRYVRSTTTLGNLERECTADELAGGKLN